tara:strand:+ start:1879 stop:2178 length:300 start_codon:yes stop_codon:yes gene_type:complete
MTAKKAIFLYSMGDLIELARFGFSPNNEEERVYGTILGLIEPVDYFVPRYKVRIQYKRADNSQDFLYDFSFGQHQNEIITVMEYDIAGKTETVSQDIGA